MSFERPTARSPLTARSNSLNPPLDTPTHEAKGVRGRLLRAPTVALMVGPAATAICCGVARSTEPSPSTWRGRNGSATETRLATLGRGDRHRRRRRRRGAGSGPVILVANHWRYEFSRPHPPARTPARQRGPPPMETMNTCVHRALTLSDPDP